MRYAASLLIYIGVLARTIAWVQDEGPISRVVWILMILYGIILLPEPLVNQQRAILRGIYLVLQSILAACMLVIDPTLEYIASLFFTLSFQAMMFFRPRIALVWIAAFSILVCLTVWAGWEWRYPGLAMVILYVSINFLAGGFARTIQIADAAHHKNKLLYQKLQDAYTDLQGYASQQEEFAAVNERRRMSREMHDSVTQTIFSMNLSVEAALIQCRKDTALAAPHIARLQELARSAAGELQVLTGPSLPVSVVEGGLINALEHLCEERKKEVAVQLEIKSCRSAGELPQQTAAGLYRILQEAINNVSKHSGVKQAEITVDLDADPALLSVTDKGCGFDPGSLKFSPAHVGLPGMMERASELGWLLEVESAPGTGTSIRVTRRK